MSAEIAPTLNSYLGGGINLTSALNQMQLNTDNVINNTLISSGSTSPQTTNTTTTETTTGTTTGLNPSTNSTSGTASTVNLSTNSPNETVTITASTPGWELLSFLSLALLALGVILKRRKVNP